MHKYITAPWEVISHADTRLADVECARLSGLAMFDAAAVVADEGLLSGHVGLLRDEHPVVVLEVVVDLATREHVVGHFQVFRDVQEVRVLVVCGLGLIRVWDDLRGYEKGIIIELS